MVKIRREPFYGTPEDLALLPESERERFVRERERFVRSMGDGSESEPPPELDAQIPVLVHPDYCEKGIELPLGFMPHKGENRTQRRAAVANWVPPNSAGASGSEVTCGSGGTTPAPTMPTRRELLKQRQRIRRGKLDVETRRLQRKAASK